MDKNQKKNAIRIDLTEQQSEHLREETGKDVGALEFSVEELEERIAPRSVNPVDFM
jgi:hypothetical protein